MKLVTILKESLITEIEKKFDPCEKLSEGKSFCRKLQKILSTGTGGKGSESLKKLSFNIFQKLRDGDYISMGTKIVLEPGNPFFESRIDDLKRLNQVLKSNNSCSAIVSVVEGDIQKLSSKKLTMIVDDQEKYSLFNRINTHSSNQSFIITKLVSQINKEKDFRFFKIDTYDNSQIIEEITELLNDPSTLNRLDTLIGELMNDPIDHKVIMDAFNFSRSKGYQVETQGADALRNVGYEVHTFSDDFGFVDYFGIDLVAVDEKGAHPVQVSSQMKSSPKIFEYNAPDCRVFALSKSGEKFIKYSPM